MKKILIVLSFLFLTTTTVLTIRAYAVSQADQPPIDYKDIDRLCPNPNELCSVDPKTLPNYCNPAKEQCSQGKILYSCPTEPCIPIKNTPIGYKTGLGWSQTKQDPINFEDMDTLCPNQDEICPINPTTINDPKFCNQALSDCKGAETIYNCPDPSNCPALPYTPKSIKEKVVKHGPVGNLGVQTPFGTLDPSNLEKTAGSIVTFATGLALIAALYLLITGGIKVMTSSGQPDKLADGKETITSAIIGLAFVTLAVALLQIIGGTLLLPGF